MGKVTLAGARVSAGLTQQEMAEKLGIERSTVNKIENGKVPFKAIYLHAYCHVTGFDEDSFLLPDEFTKSESEGE